MMTHKILCTNKDFPIINNIKTRLNTQYVSLNIPRTKNDQMLHPKFKDTLPSNPLNAMSSIPKTQNDISNLKKTIQDSQKIAATRFGADHSFYLVNGCTSGIHAALLATSNQHTTVLISRNCHKSAYGGLVLSGARPHYIVPEYDLKNDIYHCITTENLYKELKIAKEAKFKISAVLIVSPTYYGAVSNVKELSEICHGFGVPLIVDEAHGSHFSCHEMLPRNAICSSADVSIQSTQKTLTSISQTAILHLKSNLIKYNEIKNALQILQTTNRNEMLMASLEAAVQHSLEFEEAILASTEIENAIGKIDSLSLIHRDINDLNSVKEFDPLRLCLNVSRWHKTGFEISSILENEFQVIPEMATNKLVVCVLGQGSVRRDGDKLISALNELNQKHNRYNDDIDKSNFELNEHQVILTPREAFQSKKQCVKLEDSLDMISGEIVCPYPPGIPVVCPGELINQNILNCLLEIRKQNLIMDGPADVSLKSIRIINENY